MAEVVEVPPVGEGNHEGQDQEKSEPERVLSEEGGEEEDQKADEPDGGV